MTEQPELSLELSIDTCSDMASIALSREGVLQVELTWNIDRDHSRHLLPAIDGLLDRLSASQSDLKALFVAKGPGAYAGVRAGVSIAKGLAFALEQPLVGVGRLEVEAYGWRAAGGPIVAVHRAGRNEAAWAAYEAKPDWQETSAPRLTPWDELPGELPDKALVTGELEDEAAAALSEGGQRIVMGAATLRRAALLAELGWQRLSSGETDDPKSLVPLYLREPAIGPQKPQKERRPKK